MYICLEICWFMFWASGHNNEIASATRNACRLAGPSASKKVLHKNLVGGGLVRARPPPTLLR